MNAPKTLLLVGVILLAAGAAALVVHRMRPEAAHPGQQTATYYCPMHPSYTSNRPGLCPICNMSLVPIEAPQQAPIDDHAAHAGHADAHAAGPQSKQFESICYLHNCAKLHEGKPCPMMVVAKPGEKVTCPVCGTHIAEAAQTTAAPADRKILYWTDPTIPGLRSEGPGTSPMGVDLVPVYEEAPGAGRVAAPPEGYAPVMLTPQKRQMIGITTAPVVKRTLTRTVRTVGTIAHDPELYQAQQEFIQARKSWEEAQASGASAVAESAKSMLESSRFRLRHLGLSEEMINEIAGWTQPDHRLLLGGGGQFWVYASIYEYELPLVKPGQEITIDASPLPGTTFKGSLKAIDPFLDPATRTARARILVDDPNGQLKPAMYVNVSIVVPLGEVIAVPESAVFSTGTRQIVFVDKGQGLLEPRDVTLGPKADGYYEVKSGLADGEMAVTSGNFLIDSESRLRAALQGATGGPHQHGQ